MINLGNMNIADLRLGLRQVKAAYFGSKQIWGGEEPGPIGDWLCFTAEEANSTVKLYKYNSGAPTLDIETSTDGSTWSAYTQGTVLTAANIGDTIYFRAGSTGNSTVSNTNNTNRFAITGKMAASGDLQYLLSQDGTTQPTGAWCFNCLFQYQTGLTEPPKCGATTLGTECYGGTFEGCSNLRHAPELMATNFVGQKVYINMFVGCTSLTTAPKLPATTLTTYCYNGMFDGCTSLSSVEVAFTSWSNSTINWLRNVASSGTFTCPAELPEIRGINNIPTNWNIVHPQQELSAVCFTAEEANSTVKLYKYNGGAPTLDIETSIDGQNWSAYTQGTVLSAANVGDKVYFRAGPTGNITVSTTSNTNRFAITGKMAASGDIQYLLSQDGTTQPTVAWCFNCLFSGQSGLTKAPKCGATGFPPRECYGGTFEKCTGLTEYVDTPLPQMWEDGATNLQHWVYVNMFPGCTNLSAIAVDWTSWPREGIYAYSTATWLTNVAANGIFICPAELPDIRGTSNIPTGWTKVDAT